MRRVSTTAAGLLALFAFSSPTLLWAQGIEAHVYNRGEARLGYAAEESYWRNGDGDAWIADIGLNIRPLLSGDARVLEWKLEADFTTTVGDTRERLYDAGLLPGEGTSLTDRDLLDLAHTFSEGKRHRTMVRVDRLSARFSPDWGTVTLGRHAVTWSSGLIFNSFDLFNPFAPSDVVRDFKTGSDMVHVDVPLSDGNFQALAVGRRDLRTGDPSFSSSSFAGLYKGMVGSLEASTMLAWHYDEPVVGLAIDGEASGAAWHVDGTWIQVQPETPGAEVGSYFSAVANVQYAWLSFGKNTYGLLEYYYNGLGTTDYGRALFDPVRATQFARGNLFVLGRHYLAGSVNVEGHPLLQVSASIITNLEDPSALFQPRVLWDASEYLRVTFGLDIPIGRRGTEYGGYEIPGVEGTTRSPVTGYVLATLEF